MLDIDFIKNNKEIVEKAIQNKKGQEVDLDKLIDLYQERKNLRQELDEINRKRNQAAKERNIEEGRRLKKEGQKLEKELKKVEKNFIKLMLEIPNLPSGDTPVGEDENDNKVVRQWGDKPKFEFEAKAHWDLGKDLGVIDTEKAAEVSGARFTYLKGDLALMQFALINYALGVLTSKDELKKISDKFNLSVDVSSFIPVIPPVMMKSEIMKKMDRLDPIDDRFYFEKDDLVLVGSAEHTMGPLHMNETLEEGDFPLRYVGYSTSFRREAGSYGKDTRGILRQHQFDKLEMETFVLPEHSYQEQDFLVAIQEFLMQKLELPYQVVMICTGDMGKPDHRQIDIETWMPGQNAYRETHSSDLIGGFQPRRLNTKVKRENGKTEHVHMNDATAFAIGRMLIAIMENYQKEDGSIEVPEVLQKYIGKKVIESIK